MCLNCHLTHHHQDFVDVIHKNKKVDRLTDMTQTICGQVLNNSVFKKFPFSHLTLLAQEPFNDAKD